MLIVTYHAIAWPPSPVTTSAAQFTSDIAALRHAGFQFTSLDDCAEWLAGRLSLPDRSIVVTFDDGYLSVATDALPILAQHRVPATVFVIGGRVGGDNMWAGQWRSIRRMPLADAGQLRELAQSGVTIGCHTWSHPYLPHLDSGLLHAEIEESADRLADAVRMPVRHFAYPYGARGPREIAIARRRYTTALNTEAGVVARGADPHDLRRIDCHDLRVALALGISHRPVLAPYLVARRALRRARRTSEWILGRT